MAQSKLNQVATFAKSHQGATVSLSGYADSTGGMSAYNQKLSMRRADAAKQYLASKGISADQIKVNYFGAKDSMGKTKEQRKMDRRVDAKAQAQVKVMVNQ
ncbi:OmpA family protein [Dongshaea marina]|uniref:OmpA family protein n=1 Tax=Dongshaea marina TaxID=2047966 RepID=UPI003898EED8